MRKYRIIRGRHSGAQKHFNKKSIVKPWNKEENLSFFVWFKDEAGKRSSPMGYDYLKVTFDSSLTLKKVHLLLNIILKYTYSLKNKNLFYVRLVSIQFHKFCASFLNGFYLFWAESFLPRIMHKATTTESVIITFPKKNMIIIYEYNNNMMNIWIWY